MIRTPSVNNCVSQEVFSRCVEQVVERSPQVLGYTVENTKEHVELLLNKVGVCEVMLGKVRYCLLCAYAFCARSHDSRVHQGVNTRRFISLVTNVRSPPNLLIWLTQANMKRLSRNESLEGPLVSVCVSLSRCFLPMYGIGGGEVPAGVGLLNRKHEGACGVSTQ